VKTRIFLCLLLSLTLLQGCSKSGGGGSSNGSVRLVNASSANASLDMTVSSSALATTTFASGITTGNASAPVEIAPGTYTFSLVNTGSGNPVSQQSLLISSAMPYALVAHPQGGQVQLTAITEDEVVPAAGDGKIRISNMALQDSGGVDVYIAASGGTPTSVPAGVSPIATNLGVASGYFEIPQGTYQVWITGVGKPADIRLYLPAVVITNPQISTLVLTPTAGGVLVDGWLVTQGVSTVTELPNTSARIRVVANVEGSGTVVATVNGVQLDASTLVSPQVDSYAVISSGALAASVVVGGSTFTPTLPAATAGADYTLLVAGTAASPTFNLISDNNTLPPGGMAKLRLVNGVNVATPVSLSLTADVNVVAQNVAFGTASTPAQLAPSGSASSLQVTPAFSPTLTWSPSATLTLQSQGIYSVFVLGGTTAPDTPMAIVRSDR
jgi:Domain of unknown function (DUF4397)